ncbi:MAG TPA: cytochrome c maturation protein CcmE [Vicinamibacteria bacterium]
MTDASRGPLPPTGSFVWGGKRGRLTLAALAVAAVALLFLSIGGIGENLVYYWGPSELQAAGDKAIGATVRLGGLVADGSIRRGPGASGVEFDVVDRAGAVTHVKCSGVPPQMFRERIGVVVEGTLTRAGHFEGNRLMVSHGNEYRAPSDGEQAAIDDLMKSVREGEGRTGGPAAAASPSPRP